MPGRCSEIERADVRKGAKGLLKVMSSLVTVGGEKDIRRESALSVRPEMKGGDRESGVEKEKQMCWSEIRRSNKGDSNCCFERLDSHR